MGIQKRESEMTLAGACAVFRRSKKLFTDSLNLVSELLSNHAIGDEHIRLQIHLKIIIILINWK